MDNVDNVYKSNANDARESTDSAFRSELKSDIEKNIEKFRDPLVIGELLYKLLEERENTNRILKNIMLKLERLEANTAATSTTKNTQVRETRSADMLIPQVDEGIVEYIREQKHVTAENVRKKFNYRGTNGASSRLNRLYNVGILDKKQVGKSVYFFLK